MRTPKKWFTYSRNGIIYVQFKDTITGKKMTAKSTGTRDRKEADEIINRWYYNPDSFFNKKNDKENKSDILKRVITQLNFSNEELIAFLKEHFASILMCSAPCTMAQGIGTFKENLDTVKTHKIQQVDLFDEDEISDEIFTIKKRIHTLTFKDYLFLFWDYEKSPYIKQLYNAGKKIPNPERFAGRLAMLKNYAYLFDDTLLTKITAKKINTILGKIKLERNLKESSLCCIRYTIVQALNFAYNNDIVPHSLTKKITSFSSKNEKKRFLPKTN